MSNDFSDCTKDICQADQARINQICKQQSWPVNYPIMVYQPGGHWCYCHCSDSTSIQENAVTAPPIGPCDWVDCEFNPQVIKGCQDVPAGTPIIMRKDGHLSCRCLCWDGELAPYTIANGEGQYTALDQLPVGSFVRACGLDLVWYSVLLRNASRPRQKVPQQGVKLVIDGTSMVVPGSHMFLTYQKKLILANQIDATIALMGTKGKPVGIDEIEPMPEAPYAYQFIATTEEKLPKDLAYHLLDTAGVVTCDNVVVEAYQKREIPASLLAFPYPK
jgi:hypothetical protein